MEYKFNPGDEVQVNLSEDKSDTLVWKHQDKVGHIYNVDTDDCVFPYLVEFDTLNFAGAPERFWFREEELRRPDKFQPGDFVDWVYSDGSQRANGAWDGAKVLQRKDWEHSLAESDEGYVVETTDGLQGWIAAEELVPHKEPKTEVKITVLPGNVDPHSPTLEGLNDGIDISDYITDLSGFSLGPDEDVISEPNHYKAGMPEGLEVRDIIKAQGFWKEFCAGNVVKYSLRWQYKNGIEDLKKMLQYGQWLVEELEAENE